MDKLFTLLTSFEGAGVFNQYCEVTTEFDLPNGAEIRRANLRRYLALLSGASYILVGEAAGYAGCRFSGIPFTGEAQFIGLERLPFAGDGNFQQSSSGEPWRERSGTIVWQGLDRRRDCVLWNAFPWHPFGAKPLSNRRPRQSEMVQARDLLIHFLSLFPGAQVLAVGRVSQQSLGEIGIEARYVRHPSHGGKAKFLEGLASLPVVREW